MTGSVISCRTPVEVNIDKGIEGDAFLVKYQNSENSYDTGMVKINVDPPHILPTPRFADRDYELLEKVEAQCGFGWQTGTITKIFEGRRYNVYFRQGNEVRKLDHSEIRPHLGCVDGKWLDQNEAMNVPDHQEHIGEACEGSDTPELVVQLGSLGTSLDTTKDKAPTSRSLRNNMEQSADHGEVVPSKKKIKLVTACDNELPSCTSTMATGGNIVEVSLSVQSKKTLVEKAAKQKIRMITPTIGGKGTKNSRKPVPDDHSSAKPESLSGVEIFVTRKGRPVKSQLRRTLNLKTVMERKIVDVATPNSNACQGGPKDAEVPVVLGLQAKEMRKTCSKDFSRPPSDERLKLMRNQKKKLNGLPGEQSVEFNQQISGGSNQKRKRGRPRKLAVTDPITSEAGEDRGSGDIANAMDVQKQPTNQVEPPTCATVDPTASDGTGETLNTDCKIQEVDMVVAVASKVVADDDQHLSMSFGEMHSSAEDLRISSGRPANGWNETKERSADGALKSPANDASNSTPVKDMCPPFVRRSPAWKTIESMEAFQTMPQQPHFHPLAESKEDFREGLAIGYMVTFASLFEKISSLHFEDPGSTFESALESLRDLAKLGFDVTLLQACVNEMLSIKVRQEELVSQAKDSERKLREHTDGKREMHEKINEIEKQITELQEELTAVNVEMEAKDLEVARSSAKLDVINLRIYNARHAFEDAATAPWKSS